MKAPVSSGGGARQLAPEGSHVARCYQIIDHGTHFEEKYKKRNRKVQFMFELPYEKAVFNEEKGEQPFYVKTQFNMFMNEKASLRKFIEAWIGKTMTDKQAADFDITSLIGQPCMLNVVHNVKGENTYANIASIMPVPKGTQVPPAINEQLVFDTLNPDKEVFDKLPEFLQEIIKDSDEIKLLSGQPKKQPQQQVPSFKQERTAHQQPAAQQQPEPIESPDDDFFNSLINGEKDPF